MTYADTHPTIRQLIGCHEGFRKLGFPADNLFVEPASHALGIAPGEMMCFMLLKWRGKEFRIGCGPWPKADEQGLRTQWHAACAAVQKATMPQEDWDRMWQESFIYKDRFGFIMALSSRGITAPRGFE